MYIILSSEVMVHLAPCSADTTDQGNKVSCAAKINIKHPGFVARKEAWDFCK